MKTRICLKYSVNGCSNLHNKHKVYVCSFSSAKVKAMKDYSKPCIKEDKPDHLILHVGTNDLASQNNAE